MSIMDQVKQNLREWYSLAADRTSEMTKTSVRMYDKYGISREIERQLSELGCHVYHAVEAGRTDFKDDELFQAAIVRIKGLERDLSAKIAEIDAIRQQRQQKAAMRQENASVQIGPSEVAQARLPEAPPRTEPPGAILSGDTGLAPSEAAIETSSKESSSASKETDRQESSESL